MSPRPMVGFSRAQWLICNVMCFMLADMFGLLVLGGFSVFAGVGERTREGNDLYREMIESGVIKLGDKQVKDTLFVYHGPCP